MQMLFVVVTGFVSGVFLRSVFTFGWPVIVFILIISVLFVGARCITSRPAYSLGAAFFIFIALGAVRASIADTLPPATFMNDLKHRISYDGIVIGDPDVREKNQRVDVLVSQGDESATVLAVMPLSTRVRVGDRVRVNGTLALPEAFATDGGRTFRYDKYLEARGVRFLVEFGSIRVEESPAKHASISVRVLTMLARVKHTFLDGLGRVLPVPDSALAGGIVIGGKAGLGTKLTDAFTRSGLVQIIVLSGYNVMIVAEWVMTLFASLHLPRRLQFFAGGAALLFFVGVAGLSSTAIRATIMAVIALYARATGRSYSASRVLLFAVLVMLVWNPLYLVFNPGFDLSVAATAGIIWLAPIIETLLSNIPRMLGFVNPTSDDGSTKPEYGFWTNAIATTIAAQISVLPLLLYSMGLFSLVALPANLLVNPLVPLAMALAAIAGVIGMTIGLLVPSLATALGYPIFMFTRYFIFIAEKSSALPFAAFTIASFPFVLVLVVYAMLIVIGVKLTKNIKQPPLS